MKFPVQMVNNYQSLTIPGVKRDVDLPLNLILIRKKSWQIIKHIVRKVHAADLSEVKFTKFARAVFRNPVFGI